MPSLLPGFAQDEVGAAALPSGRDAIVLKERLDDTLVDGACAVGQARQEKQVVYDFVKHVGLGWMARVEAVTCDANPDLCEGFPERRPHLGIASDRFRIVKSFNDKAVSAVRKDEQARLKAEGDEEAAKSPKGSKCVPAPSRETLLGKDGEAAEGKVAKKGSALFGAEDARRGLQAPRRVQHAARDRRRRHRLRGHGKPALPMVRQPAGQPHRRHRRPCYPRHLLGEGRGRERPHRDDKAAGIQLPGRRVLLPEGHRLKQKEIRRGPQIPQILRLTQNKEADASKAGTLFVL